MANTVLLRSLLLRLPVSGVLTAGAGIGLFTARISAGILHHALIGLQTAFGKQCHL